MKMRKIIYKKIRNFDYADQSSSSFMVRPTLQDRTSPSIWQEHINQSFMFITKRGRKSCFFSANFGRMTRYTIQGKKKQEKF